MLELSRYQEQGGNKLKYLEFDVKNMAISRTVGDKTTLISGAVNYFGVHFNFDEEFASIPGAKAVEFYKNRNKIRVDLVDNQCAIPNELLTDKANFEIRVVSGNTIGTTWLGVGITESGVIMPEEPEEEAPSGMEYVKTASGDEAVPYLREASNGLEYSKDGVDWNSGLDGVPEVPATPKGAIFGRANKDWVRIDKMIDELKEQVSNLTGSNAIVEVKVDGTALTPVDGSVDIDWSAYAKTADVTSEYATKTEVADLQTLTGTAETVTDIDYSTTDISDVITSYNALLSALRARGVIA